MKLRTLLFLLLLLAIYWIWVEKTCCDRFTPRIKAKEPERLGVVIYNIQYLPWKSKNLKELRQHTKLFPVIMLQEVFNHFTSIPISDIFPEYYIARGKMKSINYVNSGLYTLSRYPIVSQEFIEYNDYTSFSYDAFSNKGFLCCVISTPQGHICFINTHTQSCFYDHYDPIVKRQVKQMLEYARSLHIPFIIGGDLNIDHKHLPPEFYSPFRLIAPPSPTIYVHSDWYGTSPVKKEGYRPYTLDYFFVHPDLQTQEPYVEDNLFSDHDPVFLLFQEQVKQQTDKNNALDDD
jgi:hypothetical protein